MSRVRLAPPHHRRPLLQTTEKGRRDVAVSHGNDDLYRSVGESRRRMAESLPHIGAVELQSVHEVIAQRRPTRQFVGRQSPPTAGGGHAASDSQTGRDELREQREMKDRDVPRMGSLAQGEAKVGEPSGAVHPSPQGGVLERRTRNGGEARQAAGEERTGDRFPALDGPPVVPDEMNRRVGADLGDNRSHVLDQHGQRCIPTAGAGRPSRPHRGRRRPRRGTHWWPSVAPRAPRRHWCRESREPATRWVTLAHPVRSRPGPPRSRGPGARRPRRLCIRLLGSHRGRCTTGGPRAPLRPSGRID